MTRTLIDDSDLAKCIEECIKELGRGHETKLFDLVMLTQSIADVTDRDPYHILPYAISTFSHELSNFRPLVTINETLDSKDLEKFADALNEATKAGIKSLEAIKFELCGKNKSDISNLYHAIAILYKHGYELSKMDRSHMTRRQVTPMTEE